MMGKVYGSAQTVLVWLGDSWPGAKQAIEDMKTIPNISDPRRYFRATTAAGLALNGGNAGLEHGEDTEPLIPVDDFIFRKVLHFVSQPWFSRSWTIQEAVLAKQLVFLHGTSQISEDTMVQALRYWLAFTGVFQHTLSLLNSRRLQMVRVALSNNANVSWWEARRDYQEGRVFPLVDVMKFGSMRIAADPKDKVYSLLSMSTLSSLRTYPAGEILLPDYNKSTTDVFVEATSCILHSEKDLFVLSLARGIPRTLNWIISHKSWQSLNKINNRLRGIHVSDDLPSWAIDFSASAVSDTPLRYLTNRTFRAATSVDRIISVPSPGRTLLLGACQFDSVISTGEDHETLAWFMLGGFRGDFLEMVCNIGPLYRPTGEATLAALLRTFTADLLTSQERCSTAIIKSFTFWLACLILKALSLSLGTEKDKLLARIHRKIHGGKSAPKVERAAAIVLLNERWRRTVMMHNTDHFPLLDSLQAAILHPNESEQRLWYANDIERLDGVLPPPDSGDLPDRSFNDAFHAIYPGRRIFATKKQYLGLGPENLRVGDSVMLVAGAAMPYLFRKTDAEEHSAWQLVGELYIHGIMDGELLADERNELHFETIHVV